MGSAFHQLCPRYSGTLTSAASTAIRLWETFSFYFHLNFIVTEYGDDVVLLLFLFFYLSSIISSLSVSLSLGDGWTTNQVTI